MCARHHCREAYAVRQRWRTDREVHMLLPQERGTGGTGWVKSRTLHVAGLGGAG